MASDSKTSPKMKQFQGEMKYFVGDFSLQWKQSKTIILCCLAHLILFNSSSSMKNDWFSPFFIFPLMNLKKWPILDVWI